MASKIDIFDDVVEVVIKKLLRATALYLIPVNSIDEQDWFTPIDSAIFTMASKDLKDFTIVEGELYFLDSGGVLARVISNVEKEEL